MVNDKVAAIMALVFVCGILAGFGIYSVVSSTTDAPEKQVCFTNKAPEPIGPYSQAVRCGNFVFISGQIGLDPETGVLAGTADDQAVQVMENLQAVLLEEGLGFSDVVQTRIYCTDLADWNTINGIYGRYFEAGYPARATVQVADLPKGAKLEIEMIAKAS